jgi:hypothetical protein
MKPVYFDPQNDRAPMPFDDHVCQQARQLRDAGLIWRPHVGCFVWDPENIIKQESPFPNRIYFVLSLPRFIEIFGDIEKMIEDLIWLPTWHQARLLCSELNVPGGIISDLWQKDGDLSPGRALMHLYSVISDALIEKNFAAFIGRAGELDKISVGVMIRRMGNLNAWPEKFTVTVLQVYRQFIEAYLNVLRQRENKPPDWFPAYLTIDPDLADGMRHFYSDYQHITKQFFILNRKIDQLITIDSDSQPNLYQEGIEEIMQLCTE